MNKNKIQISIKNSSSAGFVFLKQALLASLVAFFLFSFLLVIAYQAEIKKSGVAKIIKREESTLTKNIRNQENPKLTGYSGGAKVLGELDNVSPIVVYGTGPMEINRDVLGRYIVEIKRQSLEDQHIAPGSIEEDELARRSIYSHHINSNQVNSRIIKDYSIRSVDLDPELSIEELTLSGGLSVGQGSPASFYFSSGDFYVQNNGEFGGNLYATAFIGDGSQLTGVGGGSLGDSVDTLEIVNGTILEEDFSASNEPTDNYILSYNQATGGFSWVEDQNTGTAYTVAGSLLHLDGTEFSVNEGTLTNGKLCTYVAGTGIVCNSDDANTTYAAGSGLALASTTFKLGGTISENTNLNLYSSADYDLRFHNSDSGDELLFLDGSMGYVGIGTTVPESALQVVGDLTLGNVDTTGYNDLLLYEEGNIRMASGSSGTQRIWFHQDNRIIFEVDSKAIFETSMDWNLGSNILEANHQRRSDIDVVFRSGVDGQNSYGFMFDSTNGYVGLGVVQDTTNGDLPLERLHINGNLRVDSGDVFLADDHYIGIEDNERIVFDTAGDIELLGGNVGIGTTDPGSYKLNVNGNANITGALTVSSTISASNLSGTNTGDQSLFSTLAVSGQSDVVADSATDTLTFINGSNITITTNATSDEITIAAADTNTTYSAGSGLTLSTTTFKWGGAVSENTNLNLFSSADYDVRFYNSDSADELLFLDGSTGNIGIGTTTPTNFKLQVAGSIGPEADNFYSLGSASYRWKDLYLGGETIHLGSSLIDEATISYTASNILNFSTDSTTNGDISFFTDDFYLDKSTGNVGIGTTIPNSLLEISGTSNQFRITNSDSARYAYFDKNENALTLYNRILSYGDLNNWTARDSSRWWSYVAMSADGSKQITACDSGLIYTSDDYGVTWTARDSEQNWIDVAMSAEGNIRAAIDRTNGQIYVSIDDGVTWTPRGSNQNWASIAMSADGTIMTATVYGGQIYTSNDTGETWTARDSNRNWQSVAMSADGLRQTAVVNNGRIYTSSDYGETWTPRDSNRSWSSDYNSSGVAMSADGMIQAATVFLGNIYISVDAGVTWTSKADAKAWYGIAMSADGTKMTAVVNSGQIYVSNDTGESWSAVESNRSWRGVAMSSDGARRTATIYGGQIYTSVASDSDFDVPVLSSTLSSSGSETGLITLGYDEGRTTLSGKTLRFYILGLEKARINESGYLGIGTSTPAGLLDVGGGKLAVLSGGNVGIGISNPTEIFHIKAATGDNNAKAIIQAGGEDSEAHLVLSTGHIGNDYRKAAIVADGIGSWSRSDLHFILNSSGDTSSYMIGSDTKMIIKNSGNVGIGTTDPGYTLEVDGTGHFTGALSASNLSGTNTGDQSLWYTISSQSGSTNANSTTDTLTINGAGIASSAISGDTLTITATEVDGSTSNELQNFSEVYAQDGSTGNDIQLTATNGDIRFYNDDASEMLFLDESTGNVGIGTTSPSEKLEVAGNIRVTGGSFIDDGTTLTVPDYVFEEGYELLTIEDLESYLSSNSHLPNVPSREQIKQHGMNYGSMIMSILEKTEENTLYIIGNYNSFQNQELRIKNQEDLVTSNQPLVISNQKAIEDLTAQSEEREEELEKLSQTIATLTESNTTITEILSDHENRIMNQESRIMALENALGLDSSTSLGMTEAGVTASLSKNLQELDSRLAGNDMGDGEYLFDLDGNLKVKTLEAEVVVAGERVEAKQVETQIINLKANEEIPVCDEEIEGSLYYNKDEKVFYGCDGQAWKKMQMENQ